jgi:hypothetical protein
MSNLFLIWYFPFQLLPLLFFFLDQVYAYNVS